MARYIVQKPGLDLVGAVDIDPAKVGTDVGEVIGLERTLGCPVTGTLAQIETGADVVAHATSSRFHTFREQIIEILEAGFDVVSTAEELSFPWLAHPREAAEVDALARRAGRTVLGTGINPGFIMDYLPLCLTAICQRVDRIEVTRIVDASARRGPFQAKIGSGMTVEGFEARMAAGKMGHVGLPESMDMVSDTLGRPLTHREYHVEPVVASRLIRTDHFEVEPGRVAGLRQVGRGYTDQGEFLTLTLLASLDLGDDDAGGPWNTIRITGEPDLEVRLKGVHGDMATVAIAVNAIRGVQEAPPGLVTMRDLPIVTA
jgi:4-hydroxy-tetrahydrodipicolinate reductase